MEQEIIAKYIENEGDDIFYKVRGSGRPLLFIPPAGGDGDQYLAVADILSDKYKVFTFDRRANARSSMNFPLHFDMDQQSRDALAVLKAENVEQAFIFGNSSGAVIALNLVEKYPEFVYAAILHEPPLASLHNEAQTLNTLFQHCHDISAKYHPVIGTLRFFFSIGVPIIPLTKAAKKNKSYIKKEENLDTRKRPDFNQASEILMKYELLPITSYMPDLEKLKNSPVPITVAQSAFGVSKHAWYSQVCEALALFTQSDLEVFPGHHGSFMDMPQEFADKIDNIFNKI